ncbi:MAG: hypothetical protein M0Q38_01400 [Bacteroidales bacterium]|jgi:Holliday junction resolvasome RuvABC endonuclease subunit|nr:hypothetical protein [Bacteroidales bacterium]
MPGKPITILGISPGTRCLGYAVLSDGELVDWGLKTFKGKWTKNRERKILMAFNRLLTDYQVSAVALKLCRSVCRTANLNRVYSLIKSTVKKNGLRYSQLTIEKLKQACSQAKSKQDISKFLKTRYPELNEGPANTKEGDYIRQFEAIAVALCLESA